MTHRLFLGMPLPAVEAATLHAWARANLPAGTRPVPMENLHVTLAFLGDRSDREVQELKALVRMIQWPAVQVDTGRLCLMGRGALAIELHLPKSNGVCLAAVAAALENLGMNFPSRLHVTVGRTRGRPDLNAVAKLNPIEFTLDRLLLYDSTLTPSGAHYAILESAS